MNGTLEIGVEGIGVWSPELPGWDLARDILCGKIDKAVDLPKRPAATILPPNERRRAPEVVLLALEAAQQACSMAQRDPADLPNVYASSYGDLVINDYLCATLAIAPLDMSPTRFHNSVHNAPAGYWAIAAKCMRASSAHQCGRGNLRRRTARSGAVGAGYARCRAVHRLRCCRSRAADGCNRHAAARLLPLSCWHHQRRIAMPACGCEPQPPSLRPQRRASQAEHSTNPIAVSLPLLRNLAQRNFAELTIAAGPELNLSLETHFD